TQPLAILLGRLVETFGFGLGENSQKVNQVARGAAGCLGGSTLNALAKSVSEFQEHPFVARIAELRFRPFPDSTLRFENAVFHLPVPHRQRLVLFVEHGLKEGFNQWVHRYLRACGPSTPTCSRDISALIRCTVPVPTPSVVAILRMCHPSSAPCG